MRMMMSSPTSINEMTLYNTISDNKIYDMLGREVNDVVLLTDIIDTLTHKDCEILMSNLINLILYLEDKNYTLSLLLIYSYFSSLKSSNNN